MAQESPFMRLTRGSIARSRVSKEFGSKIRSQPTKMQYSEDEPTLNSNENSVKEAEEWSNQIPSSKRKRKSKETSLGSNKSKSDDYISDKTHAYKNDEHEDCLKWKYRVFLSFRGKDTRKTFTSHMYEGLKNGGIFTFQDDKRLEHGDSIPEELWKAIRESQIALVIFSKNYATSSWCLNELVKIMECKKENGQTVVPIFYDVDPSHVRNQMESFAEAFSEHELKYKDDVEGLKKVQGWRTALTAAANLKGYDIRDGIESENIHQIVDFISSKLFDMAKKAKEFTSSDLKAPDNTMCVWTNAMDDTLVDASCNENTLGHRVGGTFSTHAMDNILKELQSKFPDKVINKEKIHNLMKTIKRHFNKYYDIFQTGGMSGFAWDPITNTFIAEPEAKPAAADLKNKQCRNYDKLMMLYGKDRATGKHAETGAEMFKRSIHKNPKKSNDDPLTIDEVDEMIYTNAASLENMEEYAQGEQREINVYTPTPNIYPEAPTPIRNKKSKHEHLESMVDMLRGGMDKLASAISGLSSAPPISESEIWNMLAEMNLESRMHAKVYMFLCQNATACRILIGCPKESRKAFLLETMLEDNYWVCCCCCCC